MGESTSAGEVFFNVSAKLDEQKKTSTQATLSFNLIIETKPSIVRYSTMGTVKLEGTTQDINKKLETNPKTQVPQVLFTVYQHVFSSIYLLSSVLNTPYPPPDLLHPMQEKIQIISRSSEDEATQPLQNEQLKMADPKNGKNAKKNGKTAEQTSEKP
jgi:hypothetical protein